MHKTSAWPLSLAYGALIVYASLYPFSGWRFQGLGALAFLGSPLPRYWTGFDIAANVFGYGPLGFLVALSVLRGGGTQRSRPNVTAVVLSTVTAAALSLAMEAVQTYLPSRVPSNLDFALNVLGALAGAVMAVGLELAGA